MRIYINRIFYLWRLFATALSFFIFGLGCLVFGGLLLPLLSPLFKNPEQRRKMIRKVIRYFFRFFFAMMHYLGLFKYTVRGRSILVADRSCLAIANHPSLIDVVSLISIIPNACCIVKKALWHNFFTKAILQGAGYIPNDEPEILLKHCQESMARGDVIIIFPEGTRSVPHQPMKLQRGAAQLALRLRCPIRTIQINVDPITLTKGQPWYDIPPRRADFEVKAMDLISVENLVASQIPTSLLARQLTRTIRSNIDVSTSVPL